MSTTGGRERVQPSPFVPSAAAHLQLGLASSCLEAFVTEEMIMRAQQINRVSGKVLIALSLIALLAVLSGYSQPPQPDEGTGAHIFHYRSWR